MQADAIGHKSNFLTSAPIHSVVKTARVFAGKNFYF